MTEEREGNRFLINLIDSPEHVCFFNGAAAAMRISDGVLFVMDYVSGRCIYLIINPGCMREGYGSRSVCVYLLSRPTPAATYLVQTRCH